jgi:hypothetical protein
MFMEDAEVVQRGGAEGAVGFPFARLRRSSQGNVYVFRTVVSSYSATARGDRRAWAWGPIGRGGAK